MYDVILICSTAEGNEEVVLSGDKLTIGRSDSADKRIEDDGLSRVHATIYQEGDRLWIVDENSSNGTLVDGYQVGSGGAVLNDGSRINLGNHTTIKIELREHLRTNPQPGSQAQIASGQATVTSQPSSMLSLLPIMLIAGAIFIISITAAFIGYIMLSGGSSTVAQTTSRDLEDYDDLDIKKETRSTPTPTPKSSGNKEANTSGSDDIILPENNTESKTQPSGLGGKKYLELPEADKRKYVAERSLRIAEVIGNRDSGSIPDEAVTEIKRFVDGYAKRVNTKPLGGCRFGDNLQVTYERASKNAPFIVRAFNEKGIDPRIGLYLAMIESEHCVCLQSPTGPLGMFQFTYSTAMLHFEPNSGVVRGASPSSPDIRCEPEPSARAAASYMKALTGRYGTGPSSVPLAIGSYNSGEGGLSSNLVKALESGKGLPRDFWTLISKGEILSKQFQSENFMYVPKFFGAAIIGENPADFGLNLRPLSTYSK